MQPDSTTELGLTVPEDVYTVLERDALKSHPIQCKLEPMLPDVFMTQ